MWLVILVCFGASWATKSTLRRDFGNEVCLMTEFAVSSPCFEDFPRGPVFCVIFLLFAMGLIASAFAKRESIVFGSLDSVTT